jgi:hypothetical protein
VIHIHTSQIDDQKYNCGVDIFFWMKGTITLAY